MENKKDIGRAFRERLKDLDQTPSDEVWARIEADLEKKKKRRGVFWLWWPGLAAMLLVGYFGVTYFTGDAVESNDNWERRDEKSAPVRPSVSQPVVSHPDGKVDPSDPNTLHPERSAPTSGNTTTVTASQKAHSVESSRPSFTKKGPVHRNHRRTRMHPPTRFTSYFAKKRMASSRDAFGQAEEAKGIAFQPNPTGSLGRELLFPTSDSLSVATTPTADSTANQKKTVKKDESKAAEEPKPQYEFYVGGWYGPNVMASFGNASPLSDAATFSGKGKAGHSFGLFAKWKFNGRFGIQIGYSQVNLAYQTHISGVGSDNRFLDYSRIDLAAGMSPMDVEERFVNAQTVTIDQEIRYSEIPITFSYRLLDRNLGVEALLGIALMRYNRNELVVSATGTQTFSLGGQNNFLKTTSGIDAGFQVYYKIGSHWRAEVTPLFRYPLKTLESDTTFRPRWVTAQFGFSYRL
ncbi:MULTISPECIES: hypothetical protein [unclassified Flavobacterium]|uniref:hypothetical protein n=1 Tax=unclassified Flavobacterium TaxID=196869 RepID=UPI001F13B19F|nr:MULTISPECIES: hypothetical protein [unclassified Flavobacterium]UMY66824.1 hypothetical protein MKO97_05430 [Flavobacterium sp. HJ-32-4]